MTANKLKLMKNENESNETERSKKKVVTQQHDEIMINE